MLVLVCLVALSIVSIVCGQRCTEMPVPVGEKVMNVSGIGMTRMDAHFEIYVTGITCKVYMTDIYAKVEETITPDNNQFLIKLSFVCLGQTNIEFSMPDLNDTYIERYMLLLQFEEGCIITLNTLTNVLLFKSTLITGLFMTEGQVAGTPNQTCLFANTLRILGVTVKTNMTGIIDICRDIFTSVYYLSLTSDEGGILPTRIIRSLQARFPNVQQLSVIGFMPAQTINFPWTSKLVRTSKHFGYDIHFIEEVKNKQFGNVSLPKVATHDYKRLFIFEIIPKKIYGMIASAPFHFDGSVLEITITGLDIKSFERDCFSNTRNLHSLTIADNCLQRIIAGTFRGLSNLVKLDLSNNRLVSLDSDIFEDLFGLLFLDLGHNRLQKLQDSLLRNCKSLEQIQLRNNQIKVLTNQFFKPAFFTLKTVRLAFNPMLQVPVVLLYAQNIAVIDMSHTLINGASLIALIETLEEPDMSIRDTVNIFNDKGNSQKFIDFLPRTLDISFCDIHSLSNIGMTVRTYRSVMLLLSNFYLDFSGNPFHCACNISDLQNVINNSIHQFPVFYPNTKPWFTTTMICSSPPQLKGRQLISITQQEMYCPVKLLECPSECVCSLREDNSTIIIDCQHLNLTELPDTLPKYALELWFQNSSIRHIFPRKYFGDVVLLNLRNSKVNYISPAVFRQMASLKYLYLESNLITSIQSDIINLNLNKVTLRNNPFLCDCRLKWMKAWILSNEAVVEDWEFIKCTDGSEKGTQIIALEDSEFTCSEDISFDSVQHVFLPSVVIGGLLVIILTVSLLTYFQRMTVKVLLYVYCGVHPFDVDGGDTETVEMFDAVAIYDFDDKDFMQEQVINYLSDKGYKVADMYTDFIVGLSFSENVKHFIARSRRLILCLSENTLQDELMHLTWVLAYEKSLHSKTNFVVLIENNCHTGNVKDTQLRRYLKNKRYIRKDSPMFRRYLDYIMPSIIERPEDAQCIMRDRDTYIVYPDTLHEYVRHELIPNIREKTGLELGLFEFQFMPGNSVDEEILEVLDRCHRLIFILSNETLRDGIQMMILKNAIAKSMACDHNYLLLFTSGHILESDLSRDVKNYINNYVTVRIEDRCFIPRFCAALRAKYSTGGELENYMAMDEGVNIPLV